MVDSIQFIISAIQKARKVKRLTQRELSKRTNLPQSHISNIERGDVDLQVSSLLNISRSLDLEVMLVPRALVPTVKALQQIKESGGEEQIPLYQLREGEE